MTPPARPERNCFHVAARDARLNSFSLLISWAARDGSNDTATLILSPGMRLLFSLDLFFRSELEELVIVQT